MGRGERAVVLLAEDDAAQREVLQEVLEYEGFRVLCASDDSELLEQLPANPDVVLLDVVGVLTPQVAQAIAMHPRRPSTILVSGHHQVPKLAERLRADAFLAKPYELEALLSTIGAALERRRAGLSPLSVSG